MLKKMKLMVLGAAVSASLAFPAFASANETLDAALTSVQTEIASTATAIGPKIAIAAVAGIGLGAVGMGIRFLWKTFRGLAR